VSNLKGMLLIITVELMKVSPDLQAVAEEVADKLCRLFKEQVLIRKSCDLEGSTPEWIIAVQSHKTPEEAITLMHEFDEYYWSVHTLEPKYKELLPTVEFPA
jgi:hypothetical protein